VSGRKFTDVSPDMWLAIILFLNYVECFIYEILDSHGDSYEELPSIIWDMTQCRRVNFIDISKESNAYNL
jgi:hypothetical protein